MSANGNPEDDRTHLVDVAPSAPADPAPDERGDYLVLVEGLQPGRRILLGSQPITIGRVAPCDVMLPDTEMSRAHCRVERRGNEVLVTDLNSTNGTFVDGKRVNGTATLTNGGTLRVGRQVLRHELRSAREVAATEEMERDLTAARSYVESLLPARLTQGPVLIDWLFEPSARIGGDALGYYAIDDNHFALYLMDVAGHGARAALHAASVINVLRKRALPGADMRYPEQVLRGLNAMFPMEEHGDLFFTVWYGVYRKNERELRYCGGGHHPGYLTDGPSGAAIPLWTRNPMVGAMAGHDFRAATAPVRPGSTLYLFSDGLFEIDTASGEQRGLNDFLPLLAARPSGGASEPLRLVEEVKRLTGRTVFEDDVTALVATFP